jgi:hypothetical protein
MIIFVLLNLFCFFLILSKCIWADKASWNRTAHNMMEVFSPYHPQLHLTQLRDEDDKDREDGEDREDREDDCENCDQCSRYNRDSGEDDSDDTNPLTDSSISTPSVVQEVELENPENYSGTASESDESIVILDTTVNYFKKAQDIVKGLKDELEKKND